MAPVFKKAQKNVLESARRYIYIPESLSVNTETAEKVNIKFWYLLALNISLQKYSDTKTSKCYSKFAIITENYNVPFHSGHFFQKNFPLFLCLANFTLLIATTE